MFVRDDEKEAVAARRQGDGTRTFWPMLFLMFVTIATTSLSFLSLNQLLALRADVEVLKTELLGRRRDEQQDVWHTIQTFEQMSTGRGQQGEQGQAGRSDHVTPGNQRRRRRRASEPP
ncbi:hypothetical protein CRUP_035697, partial [Coryphaenoides rupestris]